MQLFRRLRQRCEQLERRELMAADLAGNHFYLTSPPQPDYGHISVEVREGWLTIRGDAGPDLLSIIGLGHGRYRVVANEQASVNGVPIDPESRVFGEWQDLVDLPLAPNGIDIDLGDGDAQILMHGGGYSSLRIRTGSGDDSLSMDGNNYFPRPGDAITHSIKIVGSTGISGDLEVDLGGGQDRTYLYAVVNGDAHVQLGAGDDLFIEPLVRSMYDGIGPFRHALTVKGTRTIDLGPDEDPPPMPADWRDDPKIAGKLIPIILTAFEQYELDKAAGLIEPGAEWSLATPFDPTYTARINSEGRMKLQFTFAGGSRETIEQLQARGLQFDAYSIDDGVAFVHLRADELRYFAYLPAIHSIATRTTFWDDAAWDFVRSETPPTAFFTPSLLDEIPASPTFGPVRPQHIFPRLPPPTAPPVAPEPEPASTAPYLSDEALSLLGSYYELQRVVGPKRLRR